MPLREAIEEMAARASVAYTEADRALFAEFKAALNRGEVRAAERGAGGEWRVNSWVKRGILLGFRMGSLTDMSVAAGGAGFRFFDKDTYPLRATTIEQNVRIVPGGSSIRDGVYIAPGVVCMPPMYVNVGAYVDEGTMIDSHALVGSCAQIGKRVHLSAAAQVGGVLEPVGAVPVIIEDDVLVGGGCGVYEGTVVRERAVLAAGTILTGSTPVYDLVREQVYGRTAESPLEIPAGAVVVPGARAATTERGREWGLSLYAPVIVKYRDEKTDRAVQLEDYLR
ncbi:MAG TPA: 2,3,4,5-tetrahydropyridine-2,6-dicarboxylate N-succinyltransferase [Pyrinomonadaceae bacterium]|jgi:2,3,4,5-tetrahydropyridine-2-carboxylate N-succinyltransferase|nr:2,3,4,5-tetrahydropyridine-2,6-dicarboxylate N-succinyltransferase [Pyrinomonadaceae bacterium]